MKMFYKIFLARKEKKKERRGKDRRDAGVKGAYQPGVDCSHCRCLLCPRCMSFDFFLWPLHRETQAYKD